MSTQEQYVTMRGEHGIVVSITWTNLPLITDREESGRGGRCIYEKRPMGQDRADRKEGERLLVRLSVCVDHNVV